MLVSAHGQDNKAPSCRQRLFSTLRCTHTRCREHASRQAMCCVVAPAQPSLQSDMRRQQDSLRSLYQEIVVTIAIAGSSSSSSSGIDVPRIPRLSGPCPPARPRVLCSGNVSSPPRPPPLHLSLLLPLPFLSPFHPAKDALRLAALGWARTGQCSRAWVCKCVQA